MAEGLLGSRKFYALEVSVRVIRRGAQNSTDTFLCTPCYFFLLTSILRGNFSKCSLWDLWRDIYLVLTRFQLNFRPGYSYVQIVI